MNPQAFTHKYPVLAAALITACGVGLPFDTAGQPKFIRYKALWDTGAMKTAITRKVAEELGLMPIRQQMMQHANGRALVNVYYVSLALPNRLIRKNLEVIECNLSNIDVLIGMDIISAGDFCITNRDGKTTFSFQIPSTHLYDFEGQLLNGVGVKKKKTKK